MPEQNRLRKLGWNGDAVHGHERSLGPGAAKMNRAGNEFLAGAAFARDQNAGVRKLMQPADVLPDLSHRETRADESGHAAAFRFERGQRG